LLPSAQVELAEKMDEIITPIEFTGYSRLHPVAPDLLPQQNSQE